MWGPVGRNRAFVGDPSSPHAKAARRAIDLIPRNASVSSHYTFVPHLTHREQIYDFPNPWRAQNWGREGENVPNPDTVDYVIVPTHMAGDEREVIISLRSSAFDPIYEAEGIVLLKRATVDA